jgi:hypothetical protein
MSHFSKASMSTGHKKVEGDSRRRSARVRADLRVVFARANGEKHPATVIDVSTRGMHLRAESPPAYGEAVTVIVQLGRSVDWHIVPARVRWFSRGGFGVAFERLGAAESSALEAFIGDVARSRATA